MLTANLLKGLLQRPCLQGSDDIQRKGLIGAHERRRTELYFWKRSTVCQNRGWTDERNSYDVVLRLLSALSKKEHKYGLEKKNLFYQNKLYFISAKIKRDEFRPDFSKMLRCKKREKHN